MKTIVKQYKGKTLNKRIILSVIYDTEEKRHFITVETKTLIDFKKREISETLNKHSFENFIFLKDLFGLVFEDGKNKMFIQDKKNINTLKVKCTEYKHPKFDK